MVALEDKVKYSTDSLDFYLFLDDNELNRDSGIGLVDNKFKTTILNLNDCKIYDRIPEIVETIGSIDIFSCQFSGARRPACRDRGLQSDRSIQLGGLDMAARRGRCGGHRPRFPVADVAQSLRGIRWGRRHGAHRRVGAIEKCAPAGGT